MPVLKSVGEKDENLEIGIMQFQSSKATFEKLRLENSSIIRQKKTVSLDEKIKVLQSINESAPKLQIKVLNSNTGLSKNQIIKINPNGIEDSKRTPKDGFTYFGYIPPSFKNSSKVDFNVVANPDMVTPQSKN